MFHTPNRCPWTTIQTTDRPQSYHPYPDTACTRMEIDAPESGDFPDSCSYGPGWQGTLDLSFSDGFYFLNWTTLVKQPKCVFGVTLTDNDTDTEKFFWTTFSDVNIPIQYQKEICTFVIRLDYQIDLEMPQCLLAKIKNKCTATSQDKSRKISSNSNQVNSRRRLQIIIICATVIVCVIAIAVTSVVFTIRKTKRKKIKKRRSDMGG